MNINTKVLKAIERKKYTCSATLAYKEKMDAKDVADSIDFLMQDGLITMEEAGNGRLYYTLEQGD